MSFEAANRKLESAHRALGMMFCARGLAELSDAVNEFVREARSVWMLVAELGGRSAGTEALPRMRFDAWWKTTSAPFVEVILKADRDLRAWRLCLRQELDPEAARPEEIYFGFDDTQSAIEVCEGLLERLTALLSLAREEASLVGLHEA